MFGDRLSFVIGNTLRIFLATAVLLILLLARPGSGLVPLYASQDNQLDARSILLEVRKVVETIEDDDPRTPQVKVRSQLLRDIAQAQADAHDPEAALATLDICPKCEYRDPLLASIAGELAETKQVEQAQRVVGRITAKGQITYARNRIAKAQIKRGDIEGTQRTLSTFDQQQPPQPEIVVALATRQVRNGDWQGGIKTIKPVMNFMWLSEAAWECMLQPIYGWSKLDVIRKDIEALEDNATRASARTGLVRIQASRDDLVGAQETAQAIPPGYPRASAFQTLAEASLRLGNKNAAIAHVKKAIAAAQALRADHTRAYTLWYLSVLQAEMGTIGDALNTARSIEIRHFVIEAIRSIAVIQAKAGDRKGTLTTLALLEPEERVPALCNTAYQLSLAGKSAEALQLVRQDSASEAQSCVFTIAKVQLQTGDIVGAQATIAPIRNREQGPGKTQELSLLEDKLRAQPGDKNAQRKLDAIADTAGQIREFEEGLAQAQAKAGNLSEALATIDSLASRNGKYGHVTRQVNFEGISSAMAANKQASSALAWARTLVDPQEKAHALIGIAKGLTSRLTASNVRSLCDGSNG
jgi:tetratricopeptide (TPR) repeat protein